MGPTAARVRGRGQVASDSVAALSAMHKMASPNPITNGLGAELALILEESGSVQLAFEHIPGKLNSLADWCSRVHMPGFKEEQPRALKGGQRAARARSGRSALPGVGRSRAQLFDKCLGIWRGSPPQLLAPSRAALP